ncbi:MAG: alanine--tRNA ligase [Muribaculaceae bacterium]|nr:alanine--tRNA ligase [Muribaculaceae bacterium]
MLTAKEIRESFKRFFESKDHHIVPSAPMVIKDDPTLMFTNAGMNQFKDIILGNKEPQWRRVADSQKCLRVSGKHNDLEEVGHDTYHHTMFEMLGNWSFGDYFKKEAIDYCWEYLVKVLGLNPENLYATVFEGYEPEGLERDNEAAGYWSQYLPEDHIINGNRHDNFWEMGETGPCGPCSEIHIDLRSAEEKAQVPGRDLVNKDNPQVIEIWNLVFMQFNRKADMSLEPLPAKVIDTGMGFERLCMALQGFKSNYDTDVFQPLIKKLGEIAGKRYGEDHDTDVAMRVVADHVRTIAFSVADGQLPSNAKAGYVIRRILRRAVRYGYTFLGMKEAFMYRLIDTLIESMGDAYPEIKAQADLIKHVTKEEEESFLRTLETGMKMIDNVIAEAKKQGKTEIEGEKAFVLYDTYGFPLDLTELILRENGMTVNIDGFNAEMKKQKERARNAAAVETSDWVELREGVTEFVGYDMMECDTEILRYRKVKQKNNEYYQIVLARTPFYAEMGGQVGDKGYLQSGDEKIEIIDTKRENNLPVHIAKRLPSDVTEGVHAVIDVKARRAIASNHTATHLLHAALRQVLGTHVEQKGSYVDSKMLRFDFSHFKKVTPEEIRQVEHVANAMVRTATVREEYRDLPIQEARDMGAMALFGEKYGDKVRVIKYGPSVELCGGTHVDNTGNIGMIKIVSESSIAAGIRRIEAITGEEVEDSLDNLQDTLTEIKMLFNNAPDAMVAIKKSIAENDTLQKQVETFIKDKIKMAKDTILQDAEQVGNIRIAKLFGPVMPDIVKGVAFAIKAECPENIVFLAATRYNDRPTLTVLISEDLVKQGLNAGTIVREAAKLIQGGGGGQPHFAQAGGKNVDGLNAALDKMRSLLNI